MRDIVVYLAVVPVALVAGALIGMAITRYILNKQIKEWQKQMETPDKEQVKNMLSALGQKPSEEQVNRFINMTKSRKEKDKNKTKKFSAKKKKK